MDECLIGHRTFFNNNKFAIEINGEMCKPFIREDVDKCIFLYEYKEKWVKFERWLCSIESANDEEVENIKRFAKVFFCKRRVR